MRYYGAIKDRIPIQTTTRRVRYGVGNRKKNERSNVYFKKENYLENIPTGIKVKIRGRDSRRVLSIISCIRRCKKAARSHDKLSIKHFLETFEGYDEEGFYFKEY
jgi:hypothetical protein